MTNSCPLIELRDDPNQLSSFIDDWSDDDCREIQAMVDRYEAILVPTPLTKEQAGRAKRDRARWEAHTTGNAYVLYIQNRTVNHNFRVQGFGKNVFQAVRRYYKGLENQGNWIWKCTKVVAVYTCADKQTSEAGSFLFGNEQESAPW